MRLRLRLAVHEELVIPDLDHARLRPRRAEREREPPHQKSDNSLHRILP